MISWNGVHIYRIQGRQFDEKGPFSYLVKLLSFFFVASIVVTKLFFKKRYKVIQFHNIPDFGVFCTLIPKIMGARIILDIHDLVPEFYCRKFNLDESHPIVKLVKWIKKAPARYADHVLTVTDIWKSTLVGRSVPESKCTVVLNVSDRRLFYRTTSERGSKSSAFTLVYHGALNEYTGVDVVIRAMDIVRREIPSVRFWIIGQGRELKALIQLTEELGLEHIVQFHRPVPREEIPKFLRQADIGIDSKQGGILSGEGLISKTMELLAMGIPAVVSRIKASQTYFDDSMVMFFEPPDEKDLARCILKLYRNPEKRRHLVANAERFNKTHSWERYKEIYYGVVDKLAKERCK